MKNYYLVGVALFMVTGGLLYKGAARGMKRTRDEVSPSAEFDVGLWLGQQNITPTTVEAVIAQIKQHVSDIDENDGVQRMIQNRFRVEPVILWQAKGKEVGEDILVYQLTPDKILVSFSYGAVNSGSGVPDLTNHMLLLVDIKTGSVLDRLAGYLLSIDALVWSDNKNKFVVEDDGEKNYFIITDRNRLKRVSHFDKAGFALVEEPSELVMSDSDRVVFDTVPLRGEWEEILRIYARRSGAGGAVPAAGAQSAAESQVSKPVSRLSKKGKASLGFLVSKVPSDYKKVRDIPRRRTYELIIYVASAFDVVDSVVDAQDLKEKLPVLEQMLTVAQGYYEELQKITDKERIPPNKKIMSNLLRDATDALTVLDKLVQDVRKRVVRSNAARGSKRAVL